ncbi:MAG TPA: cation:dicarboxylase symporter family transporter [Rhabdochlamydiaceae bacterium]
MRLYKMSLTLQMAIATLLGIVTGLFFGSLCEVFAPYASAYIMILKITAIPYLIAAIIHGVGQLHIDQAKLILKRGILFIGAAWIINILVVYLINFLFPRPQGAQLAGYVSLETPHLNFAELLIPENIFYSLSNNVVPAVVVFSLLFGISLMFLKTEKLLMNGLQNIIDAFTKITSWIACITPIGTFLIIANQVGTVQFSTFKQVSTYIILYIIGISLIVFWIFPRLTSMLTGIPAYKWLKDLSPILVVAYTTSVVIVCLPYIIELLKKQTQMLDPSDEKAQSQIQGTVSVVFNLPLGSIFITVFVFFVSNFYNLPLSFGSQVELFVATFLTSLGAVGLGSWINSLTFILDSLALPEKGLNLYLTTLPFTSGFQSMVSAMEIASLSLFITLSCRNKIRFNAFNFAKNGLLTLLPLLLIAGGIKWFNPLPQIKNEAKSIFELNITSAIPTKVYTTPPAPQTLHGDIFDSIMATKTLRVGYHPHIAPFCFFNVANKVVGYDIAFAYELAFDLGCRLELIPFDYQNLAKDLDNHVFDIAMSAVSINEQRLRTITFSHPYLTPRIVLICQEKNRKAFSKINGIRKNRALKIAVLKGSAFEVIAKERFPDNAIVLLDNYEDFHKCGSETALLWEEQEAIAWAVCYRGFRVILPDISLGLDTLAYAIPSGNPRFLNYLNRWLELKQAEGYTENQYDLWIKGKTEIAIHQEPRWSIIRNVLSWVD